MSWRDLWRSRLTTAEAAVGAIQPGDHVYLGGNAATPDVLASALAARVASWSPADAITVGHVLLLGKDPFAACRAQGTVRHRSWFVGPADRDAIAEGRAEYVPCHLSEIPRILRDGAWPLDAAVLMVSPPDNHGYVSLGVEVLASQAAAAVAKRVILQVNPRMPRVYGNSFLHVSQATAIVEAEEELGEVLSPAPDAEECAIASHVLPLIPEGATLQLGIGGIPNAVISLLAGRTDLGVHSEMISDGVMNAVEAGVVTGAQKTLCPRKVVTTFAMGSRQLYDWIDENAFIEAHPCDWTNDPYVASQNRRLVAINSAISVDLSGQVNSDSIGGRIYSGVGGQLDFIRAAARSEGGVPIIAMPSTCKKGTTSRIVDVLAEGAGVVTSRADVHYVVTEHGAAKLYGKSLRERAEALIAVAAPQHRDELRAAAKARKLL